MTPGRRSRRTTRSRRRRRMFERSSWSGSERRDDGSGWHGVICVARIEHELFFSCRLRRQFILCPASHSFISLPWDRRVFSTSNTRRAKQRIHGFQLSQSVPPPSHPNVPQPMPRSINGLPNESQDFIRRYDTQLHEKPLKLDRLYM